MVLAENMLPRMQLFKHWSTKKKQYFESEISQSHGLTVRGRFISHGFLKGRMFHFNAPIGELVLTKL